MIATIFKAFISGMVGAFMLCGCSTTSGRAQEEPVSGESVSADLTSSERSAFEFYKQALGLRRAGEPAKALPLYKKAFEALSEEDPPIAYAAIANEYGVTLLETGKKDDAYEMCKKALAYNEEAGNQPGIAVSHLNLGDACRAMNDMAEAQLHWQEALRIAKKQNLAQLVEAIYLRPVN